MRIPERLESLEKLIQEGRVQITIKGANGWELDCDDEDLVACDSLRMAQILLKSGEEVQIGDY